VTVKPTDMRLLAGVIRDLNYADAIHDALHAAADEIESLERQMAVDRAFYELTVKERDYERVKCDRLEKWKAEAIEVLNEWDEVWQVLGRPGRLGSSKASGVKAAVLAAQEAVRTLQQESDDAGG
jgi:hypothetical protein